MGDYGVSERPIRPLASSLNQAKMNKLEGSEVTKLNSESQERLLSLLGLNIGTDDEWTIPNTIYVPRMFMI